MACTDAIGASRAADDGEVRWASRLAATAVASSGVPSWKVTPGRTVMVQTVKSAFGVTVGGQLGDGDVVGVAGDEAVVDGSGGLELGRVPRRAGRRPRAGTDGTRDVERAAVAGPGGGRRRVGLRVGGAGARPGPTSSEQAARSRPSEQGHRPGERRARSAGRDGRGRHVGRLYAPPPPGQARPAGARITGWTLL